MHGTIRIAPGIALAFLIAAIPACTQDGSLRVISANPMEAGLHRLAEEFSDQTGVQVDVVPSGTAAINALLESNDPADILVGTTASVDAGIAAGQARGGKTNVGRVGIGIIVREGGPVPDVSTPEALRQTALAADGLIYNTAGSGRNVERMFSEMGIGEAVAPKSSRPSNAGETLDRVTGGQGLEMDFGLLSEMQPFDGEGINIIARLPESLQTYIVYDAIVLDRSENPEAALEFVRFITRPDARSTFAATGVD